MQPLLLTVLIAFALFVLTFVLMAIGLLLRGKIMRGGCGSHSSDDPISCDTCSKKTVGLCDDEDDMNIADVAFTATMGRFSKKQPPSADHPSSTTESSS